MPASRSFLWGEFEAPTARASSSTSTSTLPHDIQAFLSHYPDSRPSLSKSANLTFYSNTSPALPSNLTISKLHESLRGNYVELERSHSFIQWVFPIREKGMNWESQPLELHEIEGIKTNHEAMQRLRTSYEIMLDFYGMRLVNFWSGQVARKEEEMGEGGWRRRYANLGRSSHNYLRITRILKSLSELGWEHLCAPFLLFVLLERAGGELAGAGLGRSMDGYWRWCIRDDEERAWVVTKIDAVISAERWTDAEYVDALARREKTGSFVEVASDGIVDAPDKMVE